MGVNKAKATTPNISVFNHLYKAAWMALENFLISWMMS